jgi:hypothetical protein
VIKWQQDTNFTFDQAAWRRWYSAQNKTETIDPRRD